MHVHTTTKLLTAAVLATFVAACHHAPPAAAPTPVVNQDSINAANAARARADSMARADQMRREAAARDAARNDSIRMARERAEREARAALEAKIFFDYDRSELSDASRATLDRKLAALNGNQSIRIRVEGNTDERGSDEYNLALGQRRAAAAKRYLVDHGVADNRIDIISYGEERPNCQGHDESCWSQNRRDDFAVLSGMTTSMR